MQREFWVVFCLFVLVGLVSFCFCLFFVFLVTVDKESVVLQPVLHVAIYKET